MAVAFYAFDATAQLTVPQNNHCFTSVSRHTCTVEALVICLCAVKFTFLCIFVAISWLHPGLLGRFHDILGKRNLGWRNFWH